MPTPPLSYPQSPLPLPRQTRLIPRTLWPVPPGSAVPRTMLGWRKRLTAKLELLVFLASWMPLYDPSVLPLRAARWTKSRQYPRSDISLQLHPHNCRSRKSKINSGAPPPPPLCLIIAPSCFYFLLFVHSYKSVGGFFHNVSKSRKVGGYSPFLLNIVLVHPWRSSAME
ncbi:hypothetical protein KSP40_PGU000273 [Platanthera guangdongensis]|uniref:Uncharacterized protein n=1 Tax=Platanthera guangdongensis TaxID=2320717 RepID=A0ABR2MCV0_9ASPA